MVAPQPIAVDVPPLVVDARLSPGQVAAVIERCFARVAQWPDRVTRCYALLADRLGLEVDSPLRLAGVAIAADMDAGVGANDALPYHNRQHFCEVMLAANYVGLLGGLPADERGELLLAALIHDFGHDGGTNHDGAFRLERSALDLAAPYLDRVGVSKDTRQAIAAAVLATEIVLGLPRARVWYRHHYLGGPRPDGQEPVAEFSRFATHPACSRLAVCLAEADAMGSVGLTPGYAQLQQQRLAREWGRPLGEQEKFHYLDQMFGEFMVARFLAPNLEAIRRQD
jgi:hypothetical protein